MISSRDIKWSQKCAREQQRVIGDLKSIVQDIGRCERTIIDVKAELETINKTYQGKRSTREDIAYLTSLLECAKKKLAWEKLLASLQKRTPEVLQDMSRLLNDPKAPPEEKTRDEMLRVLREIQSAMERLQAANTD